MLQFPNHFGMSPQKLQKNKCAACGNNPVNHTAAYFNNTLNVYLEPVVITMTNNIFIDKLITFLLWVFNQALRLYLPVFRLLGLVSWNKDKTLATSERSLVIWEEAEKRHIQMRQLVILGKPVELYEAEINGKRVMFESIPKPARLAHTGDTWMDDKYTLKEKLESEYIPVPHGKSVTSYEDALTIFNTLRKPVIIKPRLGSRGRHTTTHITTVKDLQTAFESAQKLCHFVIIEEHLMGSVYRGTLVGGEVVGILRGNPPRITGTGTHTIRELINLKNAKKDNRIKDVIINEQLEIFLTRLGYTLETVLEKDTIIDLSEKIGISYGGSSREMLSETHPKIIAELTHAGKLVNSPVIGFDFIIADPTQNPDTQIWGIIECNSLPFINLHHHPIEGTPVNVATKVWDLWNKN
jgi:cyanophycin synthetase